MIITLTISERYFGRDQHAIMAYMAGSITPSPSPDKTRSVIKTTMWILAAAGVSSDTTDDRSTPPPNNHLPPKLSAAKTPGTCAQTPNNSIVKPTRSIAVVPSNRPAIFSSSFSPRLELLFVLGNSVDCIDRNFSETNKDG